MTLSNEIQTFLVSQIEYYTTEAKSYKEMAREYNTDDNLAVSYTHLTLPTICSV